MGGSGFLDYFSGHAALYASARPSYPEELFQFLVGQCQQTDLAIDCASGNGQATASLLGYFDQVVMTDASAEQLCQFESTTQNADRLVPVSYTHLKVFQGEYRNEDFDDSHLTDLSRREMVYFAAMMIGLLWMGMYPQSFLSLSAASLAEIMGGAEQVVMSVAEGSL